MNENVTKKLQNAKKKKKSVEKRSTSKPGYTQTVVFLA